MSDIQKPTLLILAAGMGSRYGGLKQLDGVGPNKETIIEYSIHDAIRAGFGKVVCVIRETFAEEFKERIFKPFEGMIELATVFQDHDAFVPGDVHMKREKPWGTGHAILCASQEVNTPFAVINADDFYGRESFQKMSEFLRFHCSETHYGMIGFLLRNTLSPYGPVSRGVCTIDKDGFLKTVREHTGLRDNAGRITGEWQGATVELKAETLVSMNLWGFHHNLFDYLDNRFAAFAREKRHDSRAEFYIPLAVNELLEAGRIKVSVIPSAEKWYGVTYRDDRKSVEAAIMEKVDKGIYPFDLGKSI